MAQTKNFNRRLRQINRLRIRAGLDLFVLALVGVIVLAKFLPGPGAAEGRFSLQNIADYGVSVIFFFYGLKLSPAELKSGLVNWRLHSVVQSATFILFPLLLLLLMKLFGHKGNELLWIGTFYLAALPSTVSSSVVMVSMARGNVPAAIFNASVSSLAGVFITPLWMSLILISGTESYDLSSVFIKLSLQVLLPVTLGLLLHKSYGKFALRNARPLKLFDQTIILLIVYTSFCESFANNMFEGQSTAGIVSLGVAMVVLFFVIYTVIIFISRLLKFSIEDEITALFSGSKKSLVHGTVMSKVLFPGISGVGIILLPLMMYHTLQLIIVSILAQRFSKRP